MTVPNPPSGRTTVGLVAAREIRERLRTKAFRWATAIMLLAAVVGVALPKVLSGDKAPSRVRIGATSAVPADVRQILTTIGSPTQTVVVTIDSEARGRRAVATGSIAFLVTPDRLFAGGEIGGDQSGPPARVFATTEELLRLRSGLSSVGVQGEDANRALSATPLPVVHVAAEAKPIHVDQRPLAATATVVMYLILILYGQAVAAGVNEEKSSRVVELLLSSMRPRHLLSGKVTGIGLVGLLQVALVAAVAGVTALVVGVRLPSGSPITVLAYVIWFALGYALYCTLFAAAGSLTSRPEESQQAATPVILVLVVGYLAALAALGNPNSTVVVVLSFVPLSAPLVMPVRAAIGSVPIVQVALSMLLTIAATVVLIRIAGRIYAGALLRFGPRVKLRDALRADEPGGRKDRPGDPDVRRPQPTGSSLG